MAPKAFALSSLAAIDPKHQAGRQCLSSAKTMHNMFVEDQDVIGPKLDANLAETHPAQCNMQDLPHGLSL